MPRHRRGQPPKGVPRCEERRAKRAQPQSWGKAATLLLSRMPSRWMLAVIDRRLYLLEPELWRACREDLSSLQRAPDEDYIDLCEVWVF